MIDFNQNEYDLIDENEIDHILADIPFDLLRETILEQIEYPINNSINYLDTILSKAKMYTERYRDTEIDTDVTKAVNEFLVSIMVEIDAKYQLGLDIDVISESADVYEIGEAVYNYFIVNYSKNISRFMAKYIEKYKKTLSDTFTDINKKDVSTISYKRIIKNKDDLVIIANLPDILKYIIDQEIDDVEFLQLSSGNNDYYSSIIINLLESNRMLGGFVVNYLGSCRDQYDYVYDEIHTKIKVKIMKKYM